MSQQYTSDSGVLKIPGAYASYRAAPANAGLATTGVVVLMGEAEQGPDWSAEADFGVDAAYGPDQIADVRAKYGSGRLVDAFSGVVAAANDPQISGAPSRIIICKTNISAQANSVLLHNDSSAYGTLYTRNYGATGNVIYYTVTAATAEAPPTTDAFTYIPGSDDAGAGSGGVNLRFRANGGAAVGTTIAAMRTPTQFVSDVDALAGVAASGGVNRNVLAVAGTLAVDQNPAGLPGANNISLTRSVDWEVTPTAGDTLLIPAASPVSGGADQNAGAYVIISATSTIIYATKLSDYDNAAAVPGVITQPVDVGAQAIGAVTDAICYSPVTITLETADSDKGIGKSLEIAQLAADVAVTDLLERWCFVLGTTTPVTWISKSGSPVLIVSVDEYKAQLNLNRALDGVSESIAAGGDIALKIGYLGTTCTFAVTETTLTLTRVGGAGASHTLTLSLFPTLADLADYINNQTGYSCSLGNLSMGSLSPSDLDWTSGSCCAHWAASVQPGRIKVDAYKWHKAVSEGSSLVQLNSDDSRADKGLPDTVAAATYFAGGSKGATTNSAGTASKGAVQDALDALESVACNFIVPLFSRDGSIDVTAAETDAASDYTIAYINAAVRTHVLAMSTLKRRGNRQAFLSIQDDFATQKLAAQNQASMRSSMSFLDVTDVSASQGALVVFQPWMEACKAAGMQAAGFYRAIFGKGVNISGVSHDAGDFNPKTDSQVEDALDAGLLPIRKASFGGYEFVSDQTTYSKDSNFLYNSIQAVYAADTIALTLAQRMERAFKGQSVADVSASQALTFVEAVMMDFLRLKLTAPSDGAERGFRNVSVRISGTAMIVNMEIFLAGALYFIPVSFLVSPVQQTATL